MNGQLLWIWPLSLGRDQRESPDDIGDIVACRVYHLGDLTKPWPHKLATQTQPREHQALGARAGPDWGACKLPRTGKDHCASLKGMARIEGQVLLIRNTQRGETVSPSPNLCNKGCDYPARAWSAISQLWRLLEVGLARTGLGGDRWCLGGLPEVEP